MANQSWWPKVKYHPMSLPPTLLKSLATASSRFSGLASRSMWKAFGEIVCERHARRRPFHRPANFWRFDATDRRPDETKFDYLARHEEVLFAWEKRRLAQQTQRLDQLTRELDD
jgi:hypothetical protein